MRLTEHFDLSELTDSQTAARLGLDNTPTEEHVANLRLLCEMILEPAREALGPLRISSGYRAPAVNAAVGGSRDSAHMQGYAADVIPVQTGKLALARWVREMVPFDQIICEFGTRDDPAWIHVSAAPTLRRQVLRILAGAGYESVASL